MDYNLAAQMNKLHRLNRAHSHEGVTHRNHHEDGIINKQSFAGPRGLYVRDSDSR